MAAFSVAFCGDYKRSEAGGWELGLATRSFLSIA